jgi:iron complex transport system substrate-binding protein
MRIVSLTCSNTEIVCALGAAALLVGVDDHSDYPEDVVARLPRVGPDLGIDVVKVKALAPDLVLASLTVPGHEQVVAQLEAAGLPFIAPAPTRLEHVYADVREIAARIGYVAQGEALVQALESQLCPPGKAASERAGPKVLVEWWPKPVIIPGAESWVSDLIVRAGGVSPLGHEPVKSRPITDEEACALDPDIVVIAWCGVPFDKYRPDVVYRRPAWQNIRAIQNRQVHCISEAYLGRPGPRLAEGLAALRTLITGLEVQSSEN